MPGLLTVETEETCCAQYHVVYNRNSGDQQGVLINRADPEVEGISWRPDLNRFSVNQDAA